MKKLFFIGIGGSGMNSLALFSKAQGHIISGSDRSFDKNSSGTLQKELLDQGLHLLPQDGRHLPEELDAAIYSTAVEKDNPDFMAAQKRNIPLIPRAQFLEDIFNRENGIAVSGTSGKSTVTGMLAQIFETSGKEFSFISGGKIKNFEKNEKSVNWKSGKGPLMLIEADESDGTLVLYKPSFAVVTNISKDHKEIHELYPMFEHLLASTREAVIMNKDCPFSGKLAGQHKNMQFFSKADAKNIQWLRDGSSFETKIGKVHIKVPGIHNIENALAAIQTALTMGLSANEIRKGLEKFSGIERRLDLIGVSDEIYVYDDFSHNPAKIEAAIKTLKTTSKAVKVIYQPHGFGPLKQQWNELLSVFRESLYSNDHLCLLPIYDAGGTADRSISSQDFVQALQKNSCPAEFFNTRESLIEHLKQTSQSGESIVVMGARDASLTALAQNILKALKEK